MAGSTNGFAKRINEYLPAMPFVLLAYLLSPDSLLPTPYSITLEALIDEERSAVFDTESNN